VGVKCERKAKEDNLIRVRQLWRETRMNKGYIWNKCRAWDSVLDIWLLLKSWLSDVYSDPCLDLRLFKTDMKEIDAFENLRTQKTRRDIFAADVVYKGHRSTTY
jgi:hypothetical protein